MSKKSDGKKNVVVVGGGFVGNIIVRSLSAKLHPSKCNLILVNARPYSIHMLAGARIITSDEGRLEDTAFMPYDKIFVNGNGSLRAGKVTAIDTNNTSRGGFLTLQDGGKVPYDFPNGKDEVTKWLKQWRDKYKKGNHIVLPGGGAVGIESAGELKDRCLHATFLN